MNIKIAGDEAKLQVSIPKDCSIEDIREAVLKQLQLHDRTVVEDASVRMIYAGKQLEAGKVAADYSIIAGGTLHLVLPADGGEGSENKISQEPARKPSSAKNQKEATPSRYSEWRPSFLSCHNKKNTTASYTRMESIMDNNHIPHLPEETKDV